MGSFTALALRDEGFRGPITVIERDPSYARSSTALSAASIRTQFDTPLLVEMSLHGAAFLRAHARDMAFREGGYLVLSDPAGAEARAGLVAMQNAAGAEVALLDRAGLAARFPFLNTDDLACGAFGLRNEGWFDPWALLSHARAGARKAGVAYLTGEVAEIRASGAAVTAAVLTDGQEVPCDWCVIAAGAFSAPLVAPLGVDLPVVPKKRTAFAFGAPLPGDGFPMIFDTSGLWVRPEGAGFIGGIQPPAERDLHDPDDLEPDHDLLLDAFWPPLAHRIPAMEELRVTRAWAGHYEMCTLDQNAVIGPHDRFGNLLFCCGFSGHGIQHAPAAGRGVAEWIAHGAYRTLDLSPLGWRRVAAGEPLLEGMIY
ncbi:Glycine/D-amino acid oxidase [Roseivivax lentus]|uniref:Glycine/D-amino acid oxidase n=2 Tax=Roseivivax lentus TaxID=633194 RepID=A0A1N7LRR6_9RHOB|nr:Glycine/D-amino acid oxidase [Roseivivax lentus]